MMSREAMLADERERAIGMLQAAVFTCRGLEPPMDEDEIQGIVDTVNVEFNVYNIGRRERAAAAEAILSRRDAAQRAA